ncbi:hypothetical protein ACFV9G_13635 [Nocardioides sp. NPDC059952]|uniref:hypothetical protein n=1 Tax=Nocardioides sp. NPDC059952 TaxID=3347014 RepID=UPI003669E5E2
MPDVSTSPFGDWKRTRSKLANIKKRDPDADVTELRQQLKTERMAAYIREMVDAMPPLTDEQRARLAALFGASASTGGGRDAAA